MENFIFCALTVEELSTGKKKAPWSVYTFLEYLLKHDSKEKGLRFDILVNSFAQDFLHWVTRGKMITTKHFPTGLGLSYVTCQKHVDDIVSKLGQ